ncbi:transporter substrate-binding domain-containing protein [Niveispirillum sp. BGYR6]|uniref:substrate-binding periplasmic protein n=1 Tax=Niveispirillum sp. BGYR6 TaxID=2971249 RepID=UPI0022B9D314|nr:transporter substrate-binding domain-containing protein [Niveispirillum sp. BGYR6]MDG5496767.1 transporter substrate-binding domain-containing protein [Niveispirillum sp. BGYR6]
MRLPVRRGRVCMAVVLICAAVLLGPHGRPSMASSTPPQGGGLGNTVRLVCGPLPYVSDGERCDSGIGAELARRACQDAGLSCQFEQFPWPRAQKEIETGQADILIGPYFTPDRARWMVFSSDYFYVDQISLFRLQRADGGAPPPSGRIGVPLGWAVLDGLSSLTGAQVEPVRNVDIAFNLLTNGRLDGVVAHARAVARFQQSRPSLRFEPYGPTLSEQRSYMGYGIAFASTPVRTAFEAAYTALLASPFYADLLARHRPMEGMVTEVAARAHQFVPSGP